MSLKNLRLGLLGLACTAFLGLGFCSMQTVQPGRVGVLVTLGKVSSSLPSGLHFIMPLAQHVRMIDTRVRKWTSRGSGSSQDLQQVEMDIALNYYVTPNRVTWLVSHVGGNRDLDLTVINPAIQEAAKAVMARFTAADLIDKRDLVSSEIATLINHKLSNYGVIATAMSIMNLQFSREFNESIEAKVVANQQYLKAKTLQEKAKVEAETRIIRATAEAKALALQKQSVSKDLIALREVENQKLAIQHWDGHLPTTVLGGNIPFVLPQIGSTAGK